jgi:hypothetical protein
MEDTKILSQIDELVAEEHRLRSQDSPDRVRLQHLEEMLDQCWDLLRRRSALREAGANPDAAEAAPLDQVENYLQ